MGERFDIAIVGAGPAGLSAAARLAVIEQELGIEQPRYVLLEAGAEAAQTVRRFQKRKHVMAEPLYLGLRSDVAFTAGTREQVLEGWQLSVAAHTLNLRCNARVSSVKRQDDGFTLALADGSEIDAARLVLAIGVQGNLRRLGVAGDEHAEYQLDDPAAWAGERVLVVGAGDSAIENALALAEHAQVVLANRRAEFARVKEGNQLRVLEALRDQDVALECLYETHVESVELLQDGSRRVRLRQPDGLVELQVDRVLARLGAVPQRDFLEAVGIEFPEHGDEALPELSPTYESNVPGLYVVGALAGYPLIKQALNQGYDVAEILSGHPVQPLEVGLMAHQFRGLPLSLEVDELVALLRRRVPLFRQLNLLQFRELVIESRFHCAYSDSRVRQEAAHAVSAREASLRREGVTRLPNMTRVTSEGQEIYAEGDLAQTFFTVVDGEAWLESPDLPGGRRILERGEYFGETSLLSGRARRERAVFGPACVVMETPRRTVVKLMNSNQTIADDVERLFCTRELQRFFAPTLSLTELQPYAAELQRTSRASGEAFFDEGGPPGCAYLIRSGAVSLFRTDAAGRTGVVGQCRAGELFGHFGLLSDAPRDCSAIASVATEAYQVPRALYRELLALDEEQALAVQAGASEALVASALWQGSHIGDQNVDALMRCGLGEATNALLIDESLCINCDQCERACAATHEGVSRLHRQRGRFEGGLRIPINCRHCVQPHCMKDCPPNAIHRTTDGKVYIDDSCIGCGNCAANCPYDAIEMVAMGGGIDEGPKLAKKCDACVDLSGGPACVNACPTGAAVRFSPDPIAVLIEART